MKIPGPGRIFRIPRLKALIAVSLLAVSVSARAEYVAYEGEMQMQATPDETCLFPGLDPLYKFTIVLRDDAPGQRLDGYIFGEKIATGHFTGNSLDHLTMAYPGDKDPIRLIEFRGSGGVEGSVSANPIVPMLNGCKVPKASIKATSAKFNAQAVFQKVATLFQLDEQGAKAFQDAQHSKSNLNEALAELQQILASKEKMLPPGHPQLLINYFQLAQTHRKQGSIPDEIPLDRNTLSICERAYGPESSCALWALMRTVNALNVTGIYRDADPLVHRAVSLCEKLYGLDSAAGALALRQLGNTQRFQGHFGDAEGTFNRVVAIYRKLYGPESTWFADGLYYEAGFFLSTGQYSKAEAALRQVLAINERQFGPESDIGSGTLKSLSEALVKQQRYGDAEPFARRAMNYWESKSDADRADKPALASARSNMANVLSKLGRYKEAEPLYRQAMSSNLSTFGPDSLPLARTSLDLAKLLRATHQNGEALTLLKNAYRIARITDDPLSWKVPSELMNYYSMGGAAQAAVAIFYGKEAVNELQRLRGNMVNSSDETKQAFVSDSEVRAAYSTLADLLFSQGRLAEAQQVLSMLKEQEFYDFTQRTADADAPKTTTRLSSSEQELDDLNAKIISQGKELGALQAKYEKEHQLSPAEHDRLESLRKAMDAAQAAFDVRAAAVANSAADPEAKKRRSQEINDYSRAFQGTLKGLGHEAVVVQYFILDDHVDILLTTPNAVVDRQARINRADLNRQIFAFRKTLSNSTQNPLPQATALYSLLVGPIAAELRAAGAKTLMLSLDDTLRYLPFAALYDGNNYLIENMSIVMETEAVRDKLAKEPKDNWTVWGLGVTKGGADYPPLPNVAEELNDIAGSQGILRGKILMDKAFTESSLRDGLDQSYPVIHIASHFAFSPGSMDESFLLLGDGSKLSLGQIRTKLNFGNVELLTLSACETALGDSSTEHHGVEVEGLGALAQQAGAKAVLATLWPVADDSTALLMRTLYEKHKDDHLDKADSLRQAQLALLHGTAKASIVTSKDSRGLTRRDAGADNGNWKPDAATPFAHPFYWAPFILMGNWL